ncbi:MAG TPA: HD-GYP domain-containing protein [Solirubrobacteraceae bacterium]|nr:HD-GYP domain-containing protein [Solirubrobacteraceae bacterium]
MSIEPTLEDQELLEETLRRPGYRMSRSELLATLLAAAGFVAAIAGLWLIRDPGSFPIVPAVVCLVVLAVSMRVHFDTPLGYTVPTQLAFVPLVFAVPEALVPIAVMLAWVLAGLPDTIRRKTPPGRLLLSVPNSWFSIGPVAVLAIAQTTPQHAGPILLVAALMAQFVVDLAAGALHVAICRDGELSSLLRASWIYGVDAALSAPGLLAAESVHNTPLAALAMVPLLGLLAVFAGERRRRLESMLELSSAYRGTALVLGDVIEADDGYTGEHCKSVVALTLDLAEHLDLSAERRRNLEFAALLHDVGKIAIPKEIINKPGKLDPHEWTIVKTHTLEGQKMLDRVGGFMRQVGSIVRSHHERWDGGGYPDGLVGEQIPIEARIISCCDTWNAMRTDRPYRKALAYDVAEAELRSAAGTQLDPTVVEALLEIVSVEAPAPKLELVSPDAAGAPQPQPGYGFARQAC